MGEAFWIVLIFVLVVLAAIVSALTDKTYINNEAVVEGRRYATDDCRRCAAVKRALCFIACPAVNDVLESMEEDIENL